MNEDFIPAGEIREDKITAKDVVNYQICPRHHVKYTDRCSCCWSWGNIQCTCGYNGRFFWKDSRLECPTCKRLLIDIELEKASMKNKKPVEAPMEAKVP